MSENGIVEAGIGRKFQNPSIYDDLTVFEIWRSPFRAAAVFGALCSFGAIVPSQAHRGDRGHDFPRRSAASTRRDPEPRQKQWLEIGMLLIQDPELLMLDEPVAGMSVSERRKTAELLNTIIVGRSVIVIEHDMKFVEDIAHRVTVLHQGEGAGRRIDGACQEQSRSHGSLSRALRSSCWPSTD